MGGWRASLVISDKTLHAQWSMSDSSVNSSCTSKRVMRKRPFCLRQPPPSEAASPPPELAANPDSSARVTAGLVVL